MYLYTYANMIRRPVGKYSKRENILDVKIFEMNKTNLSLPGKTLLLMSKNFPQRDCVYIYIFGVMSIYAYAHIFMHIYTCIHM